MATIVTRAGKGSPLTHTEVDANFTNLNTDKVESSALATVATSGAYGDLSGLPTLGTAAATASTDYATAAQGVTADAALPKTGGAVTGNVTFGDNDKAIFGASADLEVFHSGTHSIIKDSGTGNLKLLAQNFSVQDVNQTEQMILATPNGSVNLYYDGTKKFETTATGIDVSGVINANSLINIEAASGFAILEMGGPSGAFIDMKAPFSDDYDGRIQYDVGGAGAFVINTNSGNSSPVVIKQQNSEKLRTTASGISVTGNATFADNGKAIFGAGSDLQIYHDGSHSYVSDQGTGNLKLLAANFSVQDANQTQQMILATPSGSVNLYYSGNKKIETTATGINVTGVVVAESLQEDYDALSGTSPAPDADNAGYFSLSTSGNTTFTFGGVTSGRSVSFVLEVTAGGTHTLTWPASVDWAGGSAPDAPASGEKNVYAFITRDGGSNWYGFLSGAAMA